MIEKPEARWLDRHTSHVMAAMTLAICGALLFGAEKIGWSGGIGGSPYSIWLRNLSLPDPIDAYSIQRILPSSILIFIFKLFHISSEPRHVVQGYGLLNLALATAIPYLWMAVARELRLSSLGQWFGFAILVLNHFVLKWTFYYTAQVDMWAYVSGLAMLYAFLRNRPLALAAITVAMSFTWPTSVYLGALLILFPRENSPPETGTLSTPVEHLKFPWHLLAAAGVALFVLWFIYEGRFVYQLRTHPTLKLWPDSTPIPSASDAMLRSLNLSYALICATLFVAVSGALNSARLWDFGYWVRLILSRWFWLRLAAALALVVSIPSAQTYFAAPSSDLGIMLSYLAWNLQGGLTAPGIFYIEHVRWYGPVIFMATFLWLPMCRWIHGYGLGLSLALVVAVFFSVNPESRQFCNFFTLLIPFCVRAMQDLSLSKMHFWIFAALSLFMSKIWFSLEPRYEQFSPIYNQFAYLSEGWYVAHAIGTVICMMFAFFVFFAGTRHSIRPISHLPGAAAAESKPGGIVER